MADICDICEGEKKLICLHSSVNIRRSIWIEIERLHHTEWLLILLLLSFWFWKKIQSIWLMVESNFQSIFNPTIYLTRNKKSFIGVSLSKARQPKLTFVLNLGAIWNFLCWHGWRIWGLGGKSQDRPSLTLMIVSVNCIICPDFDSSHSLLLACRLSEQWIRLDQYYWYRVQNFAVLQIFLPGIHNTK